MNLLHGLDDPKAVYSVGRPMFYSVMLGFHHIILKEENIHQLTHFSG